MRTALSVGVALGPLLLSSSASAQSRQSVSTAKVKVKYTYYLATANGKVLGFGGAQGYGSAYGQKLGAPIAGIATTPDRRGYWLVGADGAVFSYGDATPYGSLSGKLAAGLKGVALLPTSDGHGYWVLTSNGAMHGFGDAPRLSPYGLPGADLGEPIIGAVVTSDQKGAYMTNAAGQVFTVGDAVSYGSLAGTTLASPVTAIAGTPSGLGYWLVEASGDVFAFGDAQHGGTLSTKLTGSAISIAPAGSSAGYWVASDGGSVAPGGSASSRGSTTESATGSPIVGIALTAVYPVPDGYPSQSVGFDINWPQCSGSHTGKLPGGNYTIAILGVDGWAFSSYNPCLTAELGWAAQATEPAGHGSGIPPYELYMFLNSPSKGSTVDLTGPAGNCSSMSGAAYDTCITYNYGYNSAVDALQYATSNGATAKLWWLDIENAACAPGIYNDAGNGEFWSCNRSLNSNTIQGALDALRKAGRTAGIYSTSQQYWGITHDYVPTGGTGPIPLWIAGAYWTSPPYPSSYGYPGPSVNAPYCQGGKLAFAGGRPVILQETPGNNGYPFDPDLAC